ncbi:MAG: HlyD family efflux transporter periplasmic adaptor subunit [Paracoccaceae bacterium]
MSWHADFRGTATSAPEFAAAPMPPEAHEPVSVPEPMTVVWQGVEYRTRTWSVHGFVLETAIPRILAPGVGRVFDITVLIGRGATRISMQVQVRAVGSDEGSPTEFVFVDLDRAQAEVLHRIIDHVVAHKAMSLTRLLNETEQTRSAQQETTERVRGYRTAFQLSLAGLALAAAGAVTMNSLSTIKARYGAVTVAATTLSTPVPGTLTQWNVRAGEQVREGAILGYVRPGGFDQRVASLGQRIRDLQAERAELMSRRGAMAQLSAIGIEGVEADRTRLTETLRLAEQRLGLERSLLASMQTGLPTAERLRQRSIQQAAVLQAQTDVLDARARLEALAEAAVLRPMGITSGDLRGTTPTLETVDLRLAALDDELSRLNASGVNPDLGEPVISPCTCTVQDVDRRTGEWVQAAEPLAVLTAGDVPSIHALVLGENARSIEIGDDARIRLADGTEVSGTVAQLNYNAHWPGYAGLQDDVFGADRYARVEIIPGAPLRAPIGMVAEVEVITSGLWASLRSMVGV